MLTETRMVREGDLILQAGQPTMRVTKARDGLAEVVFHAPEGRARLVEQCPEANVVRVTYLKLAGDEAMPAAIRPPKQLFGRVLPEFSTIAVTLPGGDLVIRLKECRNRETVIDLDIPGGVDITMPPPRGKASQHITVRIPK